VLTLFLVRSFFHPYDRGDTFLRDFVCYKSQKHHIIENGILHASIVDRLDTFYWFFKHTTEQILTNIRINFICKKALLFYNREVNTFFVFVSQTSVHLLNCFHETCNWATSFRSQDIYGDYLSWLASTVPFRTVTLHSSTGKRPTRQTRNPTQLQWTPHERLYKPCDKI
jgi:hypothetical protein